MTTLLVVLPDFVPDRRLSLNGVRRTHFRTLMQLRDDAKWHLRGALPGGVLPHFARAFVAIEFVYPLHRRRDADNLAGLAKPLLDGLVDAGVLEADDTDHVQLEVRAVVAPRIRETRIIIETPVPLDRGGIPHGAVPRPPP